MLVYYKQGEIILKTVKTKKTARDIYKRPRRAGSDGSMSASGSTGLGFDPWRGSKFSFENFQPRC